MTHASIHVYVSRKFQLHTCPKPEGEGFTFPNHEITWTTGTVMLGNTYVKLYNRDVYTDC